MTIGSMLALFGALALLAALPSVSVLAVVARTAAGGFRHGLFTAAGIVLGDLIFIAAAMFGLTVLAEKTGPWFGWIGVAGGLYLVWTGWGILRSPPDASAGQTQATTTSLWSSMLAGLSITLADQKAILFYLGFFPAFMDLSTLSVRDAVIVMLIAVVSVGGVKVCYAALAASTGGMVGPRGHHILSQLAGGAMMAAGMWLWWRVLFSAISPS